MLIILPHTMSARDTQGHSQIASEQTEVLRGSQNLGRSQIQIEAGLIQRI